MPPGFGSPLTAHRSPLSVVALVESESHVCSRYRLAAFRPALTAAGYSLTLRSLPRSLWGRVQLYQSLRSADIVVIQRRLLPGFELALLRRWVRRLVFDFDDAVWLRDSYSPKGFESRKRSRRFRQVVAAADLVFAGNDYLATEAAAHTVADRVVVIPTCVDPTAYPLARHDNTGGVVRLVWVGSSSTLQGLERFRDTLEAIGRVTPGVRLKVICDRFPTVSRLPVDAVPWSEATEAAEIASADIGIAWMPDDVWSQGKCGLKVLQYQAAGLPVLANPVGVQKTLVHDGDTGYQVEETERWVSAVRRLAGDNMLRRQLGSNGRRQVELGYSVAVGGRLWVEQLDRLLRPDRVSG
ncbi:MAG TPA: glycosyltransferase family 4 protein [Fimbriiglobus sp.]|nr:glycosyltransferase family 4 protein [Fimbriiglobus sp.]